MSRNKDDEPCDRAQEGIRELHLAVIGSDANRKAQAEDFRKGISLLEAKAFAVDQAIRLIIPLEEAASALGSWNKNPSKLNKIMVSLD